MTQEQKAQAYDEALGWMREMYPCLTDSLREDAEHYFPELAESEDERIRKFLIQHISEWIGCIEHDLKNSSKDIESEKELAMFKAGLAYLEKQKESLPISEMCKENANSFADEDERIRKWLYDLVDEGAYLCERPFATESILAYLERQKEPENKSASTMAPSCWEVNQKEQKPAPISCGHENGQPTEWSEEDEKDIAHIIRILDDCYAYGKHDLSKTDHENLVNKLKSLRPSWKDSALFN